MADTLDPNNVDKRTWARYAQSGQLDSQAYKQSLASLPDLSEKAVTVSTVMYEDEREIQSEASPEVYAPEPTVEEPSAPEPVAAEPVASEPVAAEDTNPNPNATPEGLA